MPELVSDSAEMQAARLVEDGLALHRQGRLPEARSHYEAALAAGRNNAYALRLLGLFVLNSALNCVPITRMNHVFASPGAMRLVDSVIGNS